MKGRFTAESSSGKARTRQKGPRNATPRNVSVAAVIAFIIAALVNYFLSIKLIFRHNAKRRTPSELLVHFLVVSVIGAGGHS